MTIPLRPVPADNLNEMMRGLRDALDGTHAILPLAAGVTPPANIPDTVPAGTAVVIRTSGSTGIPKNVAISASALRASAEATAEALGGEGQWVSVLPLHLISGVHTLVRSALAGHEPVLAHAGSFAAAAFLDDVGRASANRVYVSLVPAQLHRLLDHLEANPAERDRAARLDAILVGGQGVPQAWRERAHRLGLPLRRSYGSTETSGGCVYDGVEIGDTRVRIRAAEIQIAGPTLADGYLDDPELTAQVFIEENGVRWYRTGDAGELMGGVLHVTGRLDNVIISGGTNVSLDAVEGIVRGRPGWADAVVVGADDERWGQVPIVVIRETDARALGLAETSTAHPDSTLAALRAAVRAELGPAAAPSAIRVVPEIRYLPGGKPDRTARY